MVKKLRLMSPTPMVVIAVEVAAAVDSEAVDVADLVETDEEAEALEEAAVVVAMEAEVVAVEDMEVTEAMEEAAVVAAAMAVETVMVATKEITKPHCTVL